MGCRFTFLTHLNKKKPIMLKKETHTTEDHRTLKDERTVTEAD